MIKIGVNEKVYVAAAEVKINDKDQKSLAIGFAEIGQEVNAKPANVLDLLNEGSDESGDSNLTNIIIFPPSVVYLGDSFDGTKSKDDPRDGKDIFDDFVDIKNQLAHILKRFIPEKEIKFDLLKGIPVAGKDPAAIVAAFAKPAICAHIFKNLCEQFIAMITKYVGDQSKGSRLFLVRTSPTKHFGTIRKRYLGQNPFFEDNAISIPESKMYTKQTKGTTKLHDAVVVNEVAYVPNFNAYELKNNLDSGLPIQSDDEDDASVDMGEESAGLSPELFDAGDSTEAATEQDGELEGLSI